MELLISTIMRDDIHRQFQIKACKIINSNATEEFKWTETPTKSHLNYIGKVSLD